MADSHLAKEKDPDESSTDAPFRLEDFLSSMGLTEFGDKVDFKLPEDILKEGRQLQKQFSNESDETLMDRWKTILALLTANAHDFSAVTAVLVERHQAKMDHSGGSAKVPYVLTLANLIKLYCETAQIIGNGDILVSMEKIVTPIGSNQPQVCTKIPTKKRSSQTKLNTKDSRKKAEKPPRKKEIAKTPVVVRSNKQSADPTAKKTGRKRLSTATDLGDLTIGPVEGKRRRNDSASIGTAHDTTGAVQQANLPTSSTPMQMNSAEKQLQSGGVEKAQRSNDDDSGELSMQMLSEQFDKTSPSELLPEVIELMSSQIEDVQVQLSGQRLIDRYSCEQLEKFEVYRPSLIGVLVAGAKRYRSDPLVVEQFCGLFSKINPYGSDIDWSPEQIGFLVEIVCDQDNMSTNARDSVLNELWQIGGTGAEDEITSAVSGKPYVTKICQSIRYQLDQQQYDERLELNWRLLLFLCEYSEESLREFVTNGGIGLIKCYEKFSDKIDLVDEIGFLLVYLCGNESLRQELMTDVNLVTLWQIWNDKDNLFGFYCAQIFADFLSESPANWPLGLPSIDKIKKKLRKECRMEPYLRSQINILSPMYSSFA